MRIAWATDIHLDHAGLDAIERFCLDILDAAPDALLLTGDIAEAPTIERYLFMLGECLQRPIYFVLGNHDYYRGSIAKVRSWAARAHEQSPWLRWLPAQDTVALTPNTALIGHDGWSDGRFGDFHESPVMLNDYVHIAELRNLSKPDLLNQLNALGDEAAAHFRTVLAPAATRFSQVILLMHMPPFREACLFRGKPGNAHWLPHFTCKAVGETLVEAMQVQPQCHLQVLCGHTHTAADVRILPNLRVRTGAADYGTPQLQAVFEAA